MTYDSWKARNPADEELGGHPHLAAVQQSEGDRMTGPQWEGDTTETVKADADARCFICRAEGWHWGWNEREAVMLRCPCVDRNRAFPHMRDTGPLRLTQAERAAS